MKKILILCCAVFLQYSCSVDTDKKESIQLFMQWFEGEFDNNHQVWWEKQTQAEFPHEHIHSVFKRVDLPSFGKNIFYVYQYLNGDPSQVYRQRIYKLSWDEKERAIRLKIFAFKNDKDYYFSHHNPNLLSDLTKEDMYTFEGCDVFWRKIGSEFIGSMPTGACRVESKRSGKTIIIDDDLKLSENEIWIMDKAVDEDGNYIYGHKGNEHHKLRKCTFYKGWIAYKEEGSDKYTWQSDLLWHDQGKRIRVLDENNQSTKFEFELSELTHVQTKIPVLVFKLFEDGNDEAIDYVWTNPNTERVGINLRWIQSGITRVDVPHWLYGEKYSE